MNDKILQVKFLFVWIVLLAGCDRPDTHSLPQGSVRGVVPQPHSVVMLGEEVGGRGFRCDGFLGVSWPEGWDMAGVITGLDRTGIEWTASNSNEAGVSFVSSTDSLGLEGYTLTIEGDRVVIESRDEVGAFRGWTTLRQIMPATCEQGCPQGFVLPGVRIEDRAYLEHRGLLLDCCRHFMQPAFVKEVIEAISLQKMNVLHWHLTEDQGWRIPIEAYPKLTEVGAYREEADGSITGGHYTRQDIEDIVAFAAERHVTIIPEIEMPGHCRAALAAYPWLGCTGDSLPVPNNWGVFKDVYCAGNDSTIAFLKAVLDEVCELFPSEVIHIGGDEVPKVRWAECDRCQAQMQRHGIQSEAELQTFFVDEIGRHLESKGRRIMGWDEILEGGLPEGAMVQSWRGMEGAIEAAHLGTNAVVSPTSHCYLDYPLRSTDLEEIYGFVPVPAEALGQPGAIVGGECNMWTERAPQELVMGKVFPRATGLAEVLWSGPSVTQADGAYDQFLTRLDVLGERWAFMGLKPGLEAVPVEVEVLPSLPGEVRVCVQPAIRNVGGIVRFVPADGSKVGAECRVGDTLVVDGPGEVEVEVAIRGRATGIVERFPVAGHLGAHQPLTLSYTPSPSYTGGGVQALGDGRLGSTDFRDGAWQAVQGQDMECTVDLGALESLARLQTQLYLYQDAWIFLPSRVEWSSSLDGLHFKPIEAPSAWGDVFEPDARQTVIPVGVNVEGLKARYIKMRLVNPGVCPPWHDAATEPTWVFVDELVVIPKESVDSL